MNQLDRTDLFDLLGCFVRYSCIHLLSSQVLYCREDLPIAGDKFNTLFTNEIDPSAASGKFARISGFLPGIVGKYVPDCKVLLFKVAPARR